MPFHYSHHLKARHCRSVYTLSRNNKLFWLSIAKLYDKLLFENLETLVAELKKEGVTIVDKTESYDYGKFVHILDAEGNKIELWEPPR